MSKVTSGKKNGMYGRHHTKIACEKIAKRTKGRTLTEIYGADRASDMIHQMSVANTGSKNPAYGKVYVNGGKSVKGYYKGKFFRSLLEYSFMKHLESQGLSLETDIDYENFRIPFLFENRERTYRNDFYVKSQKIAYEVKPAYVLKRVTPLCQAKWNAAHELLHEQGIIFRVVTEKDFSKITFNVAKEDLNVVWKKETFKYFRNK